MTSLQYLLLRVSEGVQVIAKFYVRAGALGVISSVLGIITWYNLTFNGLNINVVG
jgi:hypothetical protein